MVLGITGRICAGKDAVALLFRQKGWAIIDVDKIGHQVLSTKTEEVFNLFGAGLSDGKGGVDRRRLGKLVFENSELLEKLEKLLFPDMIRIVQESVEELRVEGRNSIINAAVLEKMGLHTLCEAIIVVSAPLPLRFIRAVKRDSLSLCGIMKRFAAQRAISAKRLRKYVDTYTMWNVGTMARLEAKASSLESLLIKNRIRQD
jgi:dephospho-CoA kinase